MDIMRKTANTDFFTMRSLQSINIHGFSLVELMTALVVISVIAVFAAPEIISWRKNLRVSSAARDLYAELNSLKLEAVQLNSNVVVIFNTTNETYTSFVDNGANGGIAKNGILDLDGSSTPLEVSLTGMDFINNDIYEGANIDSVTIPGTIGFTPRGLSIDGNSGDILLRNADSTRWFKISLAASGSLNLMSSTDSTNGTNGTWK